MKKILIGIGALVVLIIAAAFIVPALIPVDTYKGRILAQIKDATGRDARIDGGFKLSVLPNVEFVAGKFSLANAPGESPAQMVMLDNLTVRIGLFPLISGNVVIDSFVLEKPVIALSVDKNGKPNWQFDSKAAPAATGKPAPAQASGGGGSPLSGLTLGDVRIVDGMLTYADARSGAKYAAEAINMKVSLPSMSSPMKADGSLVWNKEKITLGLNVANPNALMDGKQTAIEADISANPVKLAFKGQISNDKALNAGGNVELDVPSVRKLAAWAGSPLDAPGSGFGPLKVSGTVEVAGAKTAFRNAKFALDDIKGTGDLHFDGGGKRPNASARLALETVDINPYLPPESDAAGAAKPATPSGPAASAKSQDWSDEPLDLKALRQVDADLDLTVGGLIVRKIKVGKSHVAVALKDGKLTVDLTDMALYQGSGKAKVIADASQSVPAVALDFDLANFQANPFLNDAMDMDRLEGTANANLDVTGRGASQRAIVSSLAGSGKVQVLNGAIRGINLAAMVRNVQSAFLDPNARKQEKTDFAELGGTYKIRSGILSNDDLELKSPLLRVTGKGTVDLPKRSVDYRIEPKVVASTEGQGGKGDLGGIMVPVLVQGPWDDLSYKPDLAGAIGNIAKDPSKAIEGLKSVVPGAGSATGGAGGFKPPAVPSSPADAAKRLFGR